MASVNSLAQVIVCHLFGTTPLPKPMEPFWTNFTNTWIKYAYYHLWSFSIWTIIITIQNIMTHKNINSMHENVSFIIWWWWLYMTLNFILHRDQIHKLHFHTYLFVFLNIHTFEIKHCIVVFCELKDMTRVFMQYKGWTHHKLQQ